MAFGLWPTAWSQTKKDFYLIDSLNPAELSTQDKSTLDSLLPLYHKASSDTLRLHYLDRISSGLNDDRIWSQYNRIFLHQSSRHLRDSNRMSADEKIAVLNFYGNALQNLGYYNNIKGRNDSAVWYYDKSLSVFLYTGNQYGLSGTYNNQAIVYNQQGDIGRALEFQFLSLKINEELNDSMMIANGCNNIGRLLIDQNDTAKALEYLTRSIHILRRIKFSMGLAYSLSNVSVIYRNQKRYAQAIQLLKESFEHWERTGDRNGHCLALLNLGYAYFRLAENNPSSADSALPQARRFMQQSLEMALQNSNKEGVTRAETALGRYYNFTGSLLLAQQHGESALQTAREVGFPSALQDAAELLYQVYRQSGRWKEALSMHELHIRMKDSILNDETKRTAYRNQLRYTYEKQQAEREWAHEKAMAIAESEAQRQRWFNIFLIVGIGAVLIILFLIMRSLRITRKQKAEIERQKQIVEVKNQHITDSIRYAQRIQAAVLPSDTELAQCLGEYFIIYKPRDIVSGDFYWIADRRANNGFIFLAIADCTGHGVPGAFMSMIGHTLLNEIVLEKSISLPSQILQHLHEGIIQSLHHGSHQQDDGMDISICRLDPATGEVVFAGANHSLLLAENGVLIEFKGDFYSIGASDGPNPGAFTDHTIRPGKSAMLYLYTDGITDQLGGARGKKLMSKNLQKILSELSTLTVKDQEKQLLHAFEEWKGMHAQLDDILVAGFRL